MNKQENMRWKQVHRLLWYYITQALADNTKEFADIRISQLKRALVDELWIAHHITTEEMELLHNKHDCACCTVADKAMIENDERYRCNYCPLDRNLCNKEYATICAFLTQYNNMVDVYMTTGIKPKEQAFKKFRKRIINMASTIYSKEWEETSK